MIPIVDDDESVRDAIKSLLKSGGFGVEVFASAEDFLYSDHLQDTACLILDVRMPGMSGLELQRHLGAGQWRMPIIFITAHGEEVARAGVASGSGGLLAQILQRGGLTRCRPLSFRA